MLDKRFNNYIQIIEYEETNLDEFKVYEKWKLEMIKDYKFGEEFI